MAEKTMRMRALSVDFGNLDQVFQLLYERKVAYHVRRALT